MHRAWRDTERPQFCAVKHPAKVNPPDGMSTPVGVYFDRLFEWVVEFMKARLIVAPVTGRAPLSRLDAGSFTRWTTVPLLDRIGLIDFLDHRRTKQGLLVPDSDEVTGSWPVMIRNRAVPAVVCSGIVVVAFVPAVLAVISHGEHEPSRIHPWVANRCRCGADLVTVIQLPPSLLRW